MLLTGMENAKKKHFLNKKSQKPVSKSMRTKKINKSKCLNALQRSLAFC
jgi:hypothetical protein